jgi:catechol 2,3-dioxygenase-like lactoylglutathione lyase family enzyme
MIKVRDVAYVRFGAPDLDKMQSFLLDFGLRISQRDEDRLYMRGTDPSPYVHVTELGEAGFRGLAFEAGSAADLARASKLPGASEVEDIDEPWGGQRVRFRDPDGFPVEVVHARWARQREAAGARRGEGLELRDQRRVVQVAFRLRVVGRCVPR